MNCRVWSPKMCRTMEGVLHVDPRTEELFATPEVCRLQLAEVASTRRVTGQTLKPPTTAWHHRCHNRSPRAARIRPAGKLKLVRIPCRQRRIRGFAGNVMAFTRATKPTERRPHAADHEEGIGRCMVRTRSVVNHLQN